MKKAIPWKHFVIFGLFIAISSFLWSIGCQNQNQVKMDPIVWDSLPSDTAQSGIPATGLDTAVADTAKK